MTTVSGEMDDDGNEITCVSHDILALILSIHREWISLYIENGSIKGQNYIHHFDTESHHALL